VTKVNRPKHGYDCVVVGGGPAGLTAAIYLARFLLNVAVIDAGKSRALWIARTHNHAGFPDGISGKDLLDAMRQQAEKYGAKFIQGEVSAIEQMHGEFLLEYGSGKVSARRVLLATGLTNRRPEMSDQQHWKGLMSGCIRYCAICDGYEIRNQPVAVIGQGEAAFAEAKFLLGFTENVSVFPVDDNLNLSETEHREAETLGIRLVNKRVQIGAIFDDKIALNADDTPYEFRAIYPALGSDVNNLLAKMMKATLSDQGCIKVDDHQRTSVTGLFAAGDVVRGLDQISHAMGESGVAATTIYNELKEH
jgi:thioredoxin reductase (NADPH)